MVPAAQPVEEFNTEEAIEECFLAIEAVASSWDRGIFPKPSPECIDRMRDAVFCAATALGAIVTRPAPAVALRPALPPAHYDAD